MHIPNNIYKVVLDEIKIVFSKCYSLNYLNKKIKIIKISLV